MKALTRDKPRFCKGVLTHAGTLTTIPGRAMDLGSSEEEATGPVGPSGAGQDLALTVSAKSCPAGRHPPGPGKLQGHVYGPPGFRTAGLAWNGSLQTPDVIPTCAQSGNSMCGFRSHDCKIQALSLPSQATVST